jgi:hypothetical protein
VCMCVRVCACVWWLGWRFRLSLKSMHILYYQPKQRTEERHIAHRNEKEGHLEDKGPFGYTTLARTCPRPVDKGPFGYTPKCAFLLCRRYENGIPLFAFNRQRCWLSDPRTPGALHASSRIPRPSPRRFVLATTSSHCPAHLFETVHLCTQITL